MSQDRGSWLGHGLVVVVAASMLSGCAFARAVTFQSDANSFQRDGAKVDLRLFKMKGIPQLPTSSCENTILGAGKDPGDIRMAVVAAPLAAAAIGIALNVAQSEIQAYLERRVKEFSAAWRAACSVRGRGRTASGWRSFSQCSG